MKHFLLFVFFSLLTVTGFVQNNMSPVRNDSVGGRNGNGNRIVPDTISADSSIAPADSAALKALAKPRIDTSYYKLLNHPYLPQIDNPLYLIIKERKRSSKDQLFYIVIALMLFLAFIKLVFPKYFQNIFRLFFQPTFRQKQTREQLLQNNLPALLYNLFFIFAGSLYSTLLVQYFNITTQNFFVLFLYATALLVVLYFTKYLFLTFSGWVFNVKEATDTYIFVVYLINKIVGIVLIPFILILAFSNRQVIDIGVTVSFLVLSLLFLYRYLISYGPVRKEVKVSPLHFFFYILAFEITPLLLIYKVLANYLTGSR